MAAARPHVLLFPTPITGHINPFLWLANYLASSDLSVTVVLSAHSHSLLFRDRPSSLNSFSNPRIEVVPDDWPSDDQRDIDPRWQILEAVPVMEKGFDELLHKLTKENGYPPSCIVMDSFLSWIRNVAAEHGIPWIEFWTCSATVYSMMMLMPELTEKGYLPLKPGSEMKTVDFVPGLDPFPISAFPKQFGTFEMMGPIFPYLCSVCAHKRIADRILVYSFYELERDVVDALRHQKIPIEPIGPFISTQKLTPITSLSEDENCLSWLDAQEQASVLYVAFGSLATLDKETFLELALGLESSQVRFLWVIRPDSVNGALHDPLPEGFRSRTQGRSLIISWAPQLAVLGHPAVGGFLTHCGWNSTLESLCMGVPMIGFPNAAEQNTNLKCIIDWKVGMALNDAQGQDTVKCSRATVERVVRSMMEGEEGSEARRIALEIREAARKAVQDGSSKATLEKLVEDLKCGKLKAP